MLEPEPVQRGILAADIEGFGRLDRTDPIRVRLRHGLHELIKEALSAEGIAARRHTPLADLGDGVLVLTDPGVPITGLLRLAVSRLATRLVQRNHDRPDNERLRLRVVIHDGKVLHDRQGYSGEAVNHAFRLLNADLVRAALRATRTTDLVVVVSDTVWEAVVRHGYPGIDPEEFQPVDIHVKETHARAWLHTSSPPVPPVRVPEERMPAGALDTPPGERPPAFDEYLRALRSVSQRFPYVALRAEMPLLSTVYVRQQAAEAAPVPVAVPERSLPASPGTRGRRRAPRLVTLQETLDMHRHVLIEAGPGMGKSSLLHHLALILTDAGGASQAAPLVPVRVSARGLAVREGTFASCLRETALAELGRRFRGTLGEALFEQPPPAAGSWLVLVDGLDEVIDRRAQERLIGDIEYYASDPSSPYRFVVTSRPLPEARRLHEGGFGHYRLQPFNPAQIRAFVDTWFKARLHARPDDQERFLRSLQESNLTDLARVPLMLTLAILVYEEDRTRALPIRRAGLYERFLQKLATEEAERDTLDRFREQWARRYGQDGERWVDTLLAGKRRLLEHLASWRQDHGAESLLSEATAYVRAQGFIAARADWAWIREQIDTLLLRTGLLTRLGDEEVFLHDSLREYLAAWAAVAKLPGPFCDEARAFVERWPDERWKQVVLFGLGIWSEQRHDVSGLVRWIRARPGGLLFAGIALADGLAVPHELELEVIDALATELERMTWGQLLFTHPNPLDALRSSRTAGAAGERLLRVARNPSVEAPVRISAAETLGQLGHGEEVVSFVRELARDRMERAAVRQGAAIALGKLGRQDEAVPILMDIVQDPSVGAGLRERAVEALADLGFVAQLRVLGAVTGMDARVRERLATVLDEAGHVDDAATILYDLAAGSSVAPRIRERAVTALAARGRASDLLKLARGGIDAWIRLHAVDALVELARTGEAAGLAMDIATDRDIHEQVRTGAVHTLARLGRLEGVTSIMRDAIELPTVRLSAALALIQHDQASTTADTLHHLATQEALHPAVREGAAAALGEVGRSDLAAGLLLEVARSGDVEAWVRETAVLSLERLRRTNELRELVHERTDHWLKASAVVALLHAGSSADAARAAELLAASQVEDWVRDRLEWVLAETR